MNPLSVVSNRSYYRNRILLILTQLDLQDKSILDLGCGEMILYDLVKKKVSAYKGIDALSFSGADHFTRADIMNFESWKNDIGDFIFLLGVLDHLSFNEKLSLLEMCKRKFHKSIIISQRNPKSFVNYFYPSQSEVISIEDIFPNHSIVKLYLLKFPYSSTVHDLSSYKKWGKSLCTEIVYIISNEIQGL